MDTQREGLHTLKSKFIFNRDEINFLDAKEVISDHLISQLGEKIIEMLKNHSYVFSKFNITYDYYHNFSEKTTMMIGSVNFRKFYFCNDCKNFIKDGVNGGICLKMNSIVHITDGCTLGEEKYTDKELEELNKIVKELEQPIEEKVSENE